MECGAFSLPPSAWLQNSTFSQPCGCCSRDQDVRLFHNKSAGSEVQSKHGLVASLSSTQEADVLISVKCSIFIFLSNES